MNGRVILQICLARVYPVQLYAFAIGRVSSRGAPAVVFAVCTFAPLRVEAIMLEMLQRTKTKEINESEKERERERERQRERD